MTYLELVQMAMRESGAKVDIPTTIVGATGLTYKFVQWVKRAWKKIQMERLSYFWRVVTDQTITCVVGTNLYTLPSTLEAVNPRSLTCHLSGDNEAPLYFVVSDEYRRNVKRETIPSGKPQYFTILPDRQVAIWPVPDQAYTINYEGIRAIETLDDTNNSDTPTYLPEDYHEAIVWQAIMSYGMHFEDGSKMTEAQAEFRPYKKYFEDRFHDIPTVQTDVLYSNYFFVDYQA